MLTIFIDSDACPVKEETYKVAARHRWPVKVVSNQFQRVPASPLIEAIVVAQGTDKADDWIVEHAAQGDVVITADIPLAARCLEKGARVLGTKGREFTPESIGNALATRLLMDHLRQMGEMTGGPKAMEGKDRSRFLSALDTILHALKREHSPR